MSDAKPATRKPTRAVSIEQVTPAQAHPAAVVLVTGPENFLADRTQQVMRRDLRAQDEALEIHEIDAAGYTSGELFTLASPSLFDEPRLLFASGVEKCTDAFLADALRYIESPEPSATLILRHAGGNRGKALLEAIRAMSPSEAVEVVCAELKKDADRAAFAAAEFRALGAKVTPQAVRALCAAVADDLAELAAACAQLVSDAGLEISEEQVDRYFGGKVETNSFKIADTALAGNTAEALVLLRHALLNGSEPIPMLAAINMKLRAMARIYGAKGSSAQLAKEFGMAPWQVERALKDARNWREQDLAHMVELAAETDWDLKGGSKSPEFALERLVTRLSKRGRA